MAALCATRAQSSQTTNRPVFPTVAASVVVDPMERQLSNIIAQYQEQVNKSATNSTSRMAYMGLLTNTQNRLLEHQIERHWGELKEAVDAFEKEKIDRAEQALADTLAARLGRNRNRVYPSGMSLDAVLKEYKGIGASTKTNTLPSKPAK